MTINITVLWAVFCLFLWGTLLLKKYRPTWDCTKKTFLEFLVAVGSSIALWVLFIPRYGW